MATSQKWRNGLLNNNLVLVSPFYLEAGFNIGNAMARNKYIYCLADTAVIVHSGKTGGTWSGAIENLKKAWVPVWVKPTDDTEAGNADIVKQGARWCDNMIEQFDVNSLFVHYQHIDVESVSDAAYRIENTPNDANSMEELMLTKKPVIISNQRVAFTRFFYKNSSEFALKMPKVLMKFLTI